MRKMAEKEEQKETVFEDIIGSFTSPRLLAPDIFFLHKTNKSVVKLLLVFCYSQLNAFLTDKRGSLIFLQ